MNDRHEDVERGKKKKEADASSNLICIDWGDFVVHLFSQDARMYK